MSLDQEIALLKKLADDLTEINQLMEEIPVQKEKSQKAVKALIEKDLPHGKKAPTKPEAPKQPKKPSAPRIVTVQDKFGPDKPYINILVPWFFWGLMRKKRNQEWQQAVDEENAKNSARHVSAMCNYDEQMKVYRRQVKAYEEAMEKYEADLKAHQQNEKDVAAAREQKRKDNRVQYAAQIVAENDKTPALERRLAAVQASVKANTVLADQDKYLSLVNFVINKLTTHRADSIMAALNLFDEDKRKIAEFEARLKHDQFMRQLEADQRRWEQQERDRKDAEFRHQQWEHNMRQESINRERLSELKRVREALEDK